MLARLGARAEGWIALTDGARARFAFPVHAHMLRHACGRYKSTYEHGAQSPFVPVRVDAVEKGLDLGFEP
jgi:hypothetical protein